EGRPVKLVAHVRTVRVTDGAPTGYVTFRRNGVDLGADSVDENGDAQIEVDDLVLGQHQLTASYAGDDSHKPSASKLTIQHVVPAVTVGVTASPNPVVVGQATSIAVSVARTVGSGPVPTGSVVLSADGQQLGTVALGSSGQGTYTTTFAVPGEHQLTA